MTFDTFNVVFYTVTFIVPGFVWSAAVSMLVPRRSKALEIRTLECLTLSCINYAIWSWALFIGFRTDFASLHPYWTAAGLFAIIFVSPAVLGLITGRLAQKNWAAWLLGRLGFRTVHPIPSAWDYQFSRAKPYWIDVTLKNGSRIHGLFGNESFAGDSPDNRDLYLEAVFRVTRTGEWAPVEDSGGVLILADEIIAIEFRKLIEVDYEQ